MELLRSGLSSLVGGAGAGSGAGGAREAISSAETIERLVERLVHATLLDDRRDAARALKAMSRKFRVEVGVQALEPMTQVLETDTNDEEILGYALDTLCNICSPEEFEEEIVSDAAKDNINGIGEQFTEIYLKHEKNVQFVVDILQEFDFKVRRPAVRLLTHLLQNKPREMQELILSSHMGVSRLMDILVDPREVLRNDALLLLIQLTKGNANLQKIVAFENAFDKIVDIMVSEGYSDGGIVVEDCLRLMLNLLRNNASNQTFFREGSYIQKVAPFFDLTLDEEEIEIGWSAQKVSNMLHMLFVIRTLVSPSNPTGVTTACQATILQCHLLEKMCSILMAAGIPADILTETINTISESIRGFNSGQEYFSRVNAPSKPPKPALILLLMSMVNEKQPFALRCAVLYCFQCYIHKNPVCQQDVMQTLLPSSNSGTPVPASASDVSAGQLLCGGLFSGDKLSNWFSSVSLAHGIMEQENIKVELLRVQLSTAQSNEPVSLLIQICNILQQTSNIQTRIGNLILLCTWSTSCSVAVAALLSIPFLVPFLTGQIGSNEHDELERLGQGLCSFLLGLLLLYNDNSVDGQGEEQLFQLIEKRIGYEVFMDKLSEVTKHEAYNRALKHPQLKCTEAKDLIFDHKFCQEFKHQEHVVINYLAKRKENSSNQHPNDLAAAHANDPAIVDQYKALIREQDTRIQDLSRTNIYLQQELSTAKAQVDELTSALESLKDQNSLLRAQASQTPVATVPTATANGITEAASTAERKLEEEKLALEKELRIRDEIIHELEMRLAEVPEQQPQQQAVVKSSQEQQSASAAQIELDMLNLQLRTLQTTLGHKDEEIERLTSANREAVEKREDAEQARKQFESLQGEQDDLLVLLSDQDAKLRNYRERLKALGQDVEDDDDEVC